MELKEKYVYAVVSKLPEKQRNEITKEINILIDDMMESAQGKDDTERLENVLLGLGDPSELADKYRDQTRFLIGPKYYNNYIYTLKIVLIAVVIGISISAMFGIFEKDILKVFTNYIPNLISALTAAFTWVTIIFALFEYNKVDLYTGKEKWSLKKLQPIPAKKAIISRGETIFGIIFSTAFLILFYSQLFAIFIPKTEGGFEKIPFFNYDKLDYFKYLILIIFLIGIAKEVLKLVYGKWNLTLAIMYSLLSLISMIFFVMIFSNHEIWNVNIITQIADTLKIDHSKIKYGFDQAINIIIGIGIFGSIIDIMVALLKGFKFNDSSKLIN